MGDSSAVGGKLNDSGVIELTGKIMVVAVLVLFLVVVIVFLLHLYSKWFWNRRQEASANNNTNTTTRRRRRRFDFSPGYQELNVAAALRRGLDPSVLKTIPVVVFSTNDFKDGLECAVCLSVVSEAEKIRLLPKCNHGFHVECIDMWFESHSTCPLCRNPVSNQSSTSPELATMESIILEASNQENAGVNGYSTESLNFPTNVLFWGNETQVSTFGPPLEEGHQGLNSAQTPSTSSSSPSLCTSNRPDGMLVIDIPRHINEDEEQKSPMPTRMRSLKRLLSRDNRRVSPRSAFDVDVEQQVGRVES
ncbi:hypothetical protein ACH5RR_024271 [Cinchona calisaya]|uniref:RING-type E3 ubiquitin transferase n=1 Tax=Cinchona calisaya TaxID=153742 RepID=A0ABD2YYX3_9GENT